MKKTFSITLSALVTALSTVLMLTAYFPYFTYALPAVAGALALILIIEISPKYAFVSYVATSVIAFILCEKEAALMYVFLFGYYPILKGVLEKHFPRAVEYILKILVFNIAVTLIYFVFAKIFLVENSDEIFGKYGPIILYALGNIAFVLYDICLSRLSVFYLLKFHKKVSGLFKGKNNGN